MSQNTLESLVQKSAPITNLFRRMIENPVILKELRGRMRGRRSFVSLTIYTLLLSIFIGSIYTLVTIQGGGARWDPSFRQNIGKAIFSSVVLFEFLLIGFIGPSLTTGAITSERERRTFDLLRTTLLSARALVFGKLGSACMYLLLLIIIGLPIEALAFLLGGVGLEEILVSSVILIVNILFFCSLGLFCSSFTKRTLTANVTSYALMLIGTMGLGMAYFALGIYASSNLNSYNQLSQDFLTMIAWMLTATNSFSAAIVSEVMLISNQTLFYGKAPSGNIYIISPWVVHVVLYLFLTAIMLFLSVIFVKRPDR